MQKLNNAIRSFPWYLILWPIFYALNINAAFYGVIEQKEMWLQILKWELMLFAVYFFFRFIFSNTAAAVIVTVWIGFLYFYAYTFHFFFAKFTLTAWLSPFPGMILFWLISTLALILFFLRTRSRPVKLSTFIMVVFIALSFYECINYIIKVSNNRTESFETKYRPVLEAGLPGPGNASGTDPDIYQLVFDSYTHTQCLKSQFNYDNSVLDTLLKREGFYVASNSKSNYFDTPVSIASLFNLNYIPYADKTRNETELSFFCGLRNLDNNHLWNFLEQRGYTIKNLGVFPIKKYPSGLRNIYFGSSDRDILVHKTLENVQLPPFKDFFDPPAVKTMKDFNRATVDDIIADTLAIENELKKAVSNASVRPLFFYSHFPLPHPPYMLDSMGRLKNISRIKPDDADAYVEQCIYLRQTILRWVKLIKDSGRPCVILVQGDHGYRYFDTETNKKECFNILNAWYFSDRDYKHLYDSISLVNTYRMILNKFYGARFSLLKDTSYYPN